MKKIDSKQALLEYLSERMRYGRVTGTMRAFDSVLESLRLTDKSGQRGGEWLGSPLNDDTRLPQCDGSRYTIATDTPTVVSPTSMFTRLISRLIAVSPTHYLSDETRDGVEELFRLANHVIPESAYWVWRENMRFDEEYKPALFVEQLRGLDLLKTDEYWWHFPHVSVDDPSLVAYTPSPDYGQRDRQVRMKVGRYLQQFYGDVLSADQIRSMANGVKKLTLLWANTAKEIAHVYINGPSSCMGGRDRFTNFISHPAEVYASGDFTVAYLEDEVTGEIAARAVVSKANTPHYYVRLYSRYNDAGETLAEMLEEQGIERQSSWGGERLVCIEADYDHGYVMPYLDGGEQDIGLVREGGVRFWRIGVRGEITVCANETSGWVCDEPRGYCDHCEEDTDESPDDLEYSEYHDIHIGRCCIESYRYARTSGSRHSSTWVHEDEVIYNEDDGDYYLESIAEDCGVVYCEYGGEWRNADNCVQDHNGDWVLSEDAIAVYTADGDVEYVAKYDTYTLFMCAYDMHNKQWQQIADNDAYTDAKRIVDDFGNEFVDGFFSPYRYVRAFGDSALHDYLYQNLDMYVGTYRIRNGLNKVQASPIRADITATL